jgi:hypothetical protein
LWARRQALERWLSWFLRETGRDTILKTKWTPSVPRPKLCQDGLMSRNQANLKMPCPAPTWLRPRHGLNARLRLPPASLAMRSRAENAAVGRSIETAFFCISAFVAVLGAVTDTTSASASVILVIGTVQAIGRVRPDIKANGKGRRELPQAATGLKVICPRFPSFLLFGRGRETISTSRSNAVRKAIRRSTEYSRKFPLNNRETSG